MCVFDFNAPNVICYNLFNLFGNSCHLFIWMKPHSVVSLQVDLLSNNCVHSIAEQYQTLLHVADVLLALHLRTCQWWIDCPVVSTLWNCHFILDRAHEVIL